MLGFDWASMKKKNAQPLQLRDNCGSESSGDDAYMSPIETAPIKGTPMVTTNDMEDLKNTLNQFIQGIHQREQQANNMLTQKMSTAFKNVHNLMKKDMKQEMQVFTDSFKRQLVFQSPQVAAGSPGDPDGSNDPSSSNNQSDHSVSSIGDNDETWNHSFPPQPEAKPTVTPRSKQFRKKDNPKASLRTPISPHNPHFYVGCNDDALETTTVGTEGTLTKEQRQHQKKVENWMTKIRHEWQVKTATLCTSTY